jgi:Arc/MetJ-type ribon-helix-helix transcriptional regulator
MADEEDVDTSRKTVKTFVPAYQKEEWKRHAEELDMSQSEFVRTMVQAGRSDFEIEPIQSAEPDSNSSERGDDRGFEERVLSALSESEYPSWDELVNQLVDDIEEQLDESLQRLQRENRIEYSGRHGGYAVVTENDEH